ncbi:MAG: Holliday junction branch migration DNA helicase RuvB [Candidatus Nealsonbacteria bacterium]|nr:Holliday junction branch migration DNA helicase RuvB [Candidatus Nealsonbacteria bacterium]
MKNLSSPEEETANDYVFDSTLRPSAWSEYIGQEKIKKNVQVIIGAAKKRKESCCEHILLYGGSGLGKTTLARLIAKEMGSKIKITSGTSIERSGDLVALLTNLPEGGIIFIDELHRLSKNCEETIYPALEDYKLDLILGKGPMARTLELKLPRFTLIGATTRLAFLSSPLRSRFGATFKLDFYNIEEMERIIKRSAKILEIGIDDDSIKIIASRSRFTPRVANRLLKRVRDFTQIENKDKITEELTEKALKMLEVDELGLEPGDKKILEVLVDKFKGGPVGLQALSAACGEEEETILDIYEPYLLQMGLIERTSRGRIATSKTYQHLA